LGSKAASLTFPSRSFHFLQPLHGFFAGFAAQGILAHRLVILGEDAQRFFGAQRVFIAVYVYFSPCG